MSRNFNPVDWVSIPTHTTGNQTPPLSVRGRTWIRSAWEIELHVEKDSAPGVYVYFDRGREFDVFFDRTINVRFHGPVNMTIFRHVPTESTFSEAGGEVDFVNIDSMPETSGHMQQVLAALRAQELRHQADMIEAYKALGRSLDPQVNPSYIEPVMPAANADGDTDV